MRAGHARSSRPEPAGAVLPLVPGGDGQRHAGRRRIEVVLHDRGERYPQRGEVSQQRRHLGLAEAGLDHGAELRGLGEGQALGSHLGRHVRDEAAAAAFLDQMADATAFGRVGDPAEVAAAVLFLATPASSFVTGSELFADGGQVHANP